MPGRSTALTTRLVLVVLVLLGAGAAVVDGLLLSGAVTMSAGGGRSCGQRPGASRSLASRAPAASPTGILSLGLGSRALTPLVTAEPGLAHPAFSPDGRRIAFLAGSNGIVGRLEICDLARHTVSSVPMTIPAGDFPLGWSKTGASLVFLGGDTLGYGAEQRPFVVEPSGARLRAIAGTSGWYYDGVAVSPDGTKLALLLQRRYPHGQEPEELAVLDLASGRLQRVAGSDQVAEIDAVSWSPDGTKLAFSAYKQNDRGGLYVVDLRTRALTPLLVRGAGARDPAWAPDGRSIAFVRGGPRSSSIWLLDLASGATERLTRGANDGAPAWAPDGRSLVFVRRALAASGS